MTLIRSISGIRGTIGGKPSHGLTPLDVVRFTSAFGTYIKAEAGAKDCYRIVVGRDARISGPMVAQLVNGTLSGLGIDVIHLGLSTTPTVEMAVVYHKADGGIVLTASHNPKQWNALKLLNAKGEFISAAAGQHVLDMAATDNYTYAEVSKLGRTTVDSDAIDRHIAAILALPTVDVAAIRAKKLHVVTDCVNSTGGISVPKLLIALGVDKVTELFSDPTGEFPHNPEPLPEHLSEISAVVKRQNAHLGIVVDPDVDRLALVCEDGEMFGEEYTLVAVADHILRSKKGATVSNLSSTRALQDITEKVGCTYHASAVGEVNVVEKMKEVDAVIGGEGNGGIIYPELHHGRDALVGIALFLTHYANKGMPASHLRAQYPNYHISKNKVSLTEETDVDAILHAITKKYSEQPINTIDGVRIEFGQEWVHLRKSNTEPIIRIYSESQNSVTAETLAEKIISDIKELMKAQMA